MCLYQDNVTYVIVLAVTVFFASTAPDFASLGTVGAILRITAIVSVTATGMTLVIIAAETDLSVGSVASCAGTILSLLLANGLLVTALRIPSFLVTPGMLGVFSGAARR